MAEHLFCFECACRQDHVEVARDLFACVKCGRRRDLADEDLYEA